MKSKLKKELIITLSYDKISSNNKNNSVKVKVLFLDSGVF
jgi:hypothetical protein